MMFGSTSKETLCTSCSHLEVCSLKGTYLEAQHAVDTLAFNLDTEKDEGGRITRLCDIHWIESVNLQCKHYSSNPTYRANENTVKGMF